MIPLSEMNETMFERNKLTDAQQKKLTVIRGGLDAAYEREEMPRYHGDE